MVCNYSTKKGAEFDPVTRPMLDKHGSTTAFV